MIREGLIDTAVASRKISSLTCASPRRSVMGTGMELIWHRLLWM